MVYVFLANGFELVEAMTPVDMLRRGGKKTVTVSITDSYYVTSSNNVTVKADKLISELDSSVPEAVILPLCPDKGTCLHYDPNLSASVYLENDLELLMRTHS